LQYDVAEASAGCHKTRSGGFMPPSGIEFTGEMARKPATTLLSTIFPRARPEKNLENFGISQNVDENTTA
jgi:hypothetical protein